MKELQKGDIAEVNTPNKITIKAVVLDVIQMYYDSDYIDFIYHVCSK